MDEVLALDDVVSGRGVIASTHVCAYGFEGPLLVPKILGNNHPSLYPVRLSVVVHDFFPGVAPHIYGTLDLALLGFLPVVAGSLYGSHHHPQVGVYFLVHSLAHIARRCILLGYSELITSSAIQRSR